MYSQHTKYQPRAPIANTNHENPSKFPLSIKYPYLVPNTSTASIDYPRARTTIDRPAIITLPSANCASALGTSSTLVTYPSNHWHSAIPHTHALCVSAVCAAHASCPGVAQSHQQDPAPGSFNIYHLSPAAPFFFPLVNTTTAASLSLPISDSQGTRGLPGNY